VLNQERNEHVPSTLRRGTIFSHTFELSCLAGLALGAPPCREIYIGIMMDPFLTTLIFPNSAWDINLPKSYYFELVQVEYYYIVPISAQPKFYGATNFLGATNCPPY